MSTRASNVRRTGRPGLSAMVVGALLLAGLLASTPAGAQSPLPGLTVTSVAADGTESTVAAYRWLIEQDKTYHVQTQSVCEDGVTACASDAQCAGIGTGLCRQGAADPTTFDPNWQQANDGWPGGETLSVAFHQSYMPVVGKGCVGFDDLIGPDFACNALAPGLEGNTHYHVSVVPRSGASIGGASFKTNAAGEMPDTIVYVNEHPIPTAQITILVFNDNNSINNAPDLPAEDPIVSNFDMSGFQILVEDAGGRYGASAGIQSQDAFGNPLGTTYDALGNPSGHEPLITGPDGRLTIKNLAPGKYGIQAVPPAGSGWVQTATIEGTKVIDAWVKANEPPFFAEFGPPGFHVFIGFVKKFNDLSGEPGSGTTITGTIVNNHLSRPPEYAFHDGACFGHTQPWVGLNELSGGIPGPGRVAIATDADCNFSIPDVPPGTYQLVVWDSALDLIFAFHGISIGNAVGDTCAPGSPCDLGPVPVFQWFHRQEHRVFDDPNGNGQWDSGEGPSALEQAFNLRWRDGTIYQSNVSDGTGAFAFDQVFPFFSWLVAEVDFLRFQATGLQVVVDNGGAIPAIAGDPPLDGTDWTFGGAIAPQDQTNPPDPECALGFCDESTLFRVEHGPALLQGFQGFIGQTNAFLWGKRHYPDLCEDRVTECTSDAECFGIGSGTCSVPGNGGISGIAFYAVTRAENYPQYAAAEVWEPGIPGVTVNLYDESGATLLNSTVTDSWDDSIPTRCKWGNGATGPFFWSPDGTTQYETDCFDGLRNFNQARPAVFDGGYAFDAICAGGLGNCTSDDDPDWITPMPIGDYVVEVIPPPGYEVIKAQDKNVDFGDEFQPAPELLPPPCVGPLYTVPTRLTLFPDENIGAPFAGENLTLCDRKLVTVSSGANAAADFSLFTEVPIAAHGVGFILDDTTNEFNPASPQFGEKFAPPFVPITIRDWTGRVIGKTLSDQYGNYNFIAPSTVSANLPQPSGMSPNMLTACMNDPGDDLAYPDPNWNQQYSTFCYTLQYMPGTTTYLDTPVVPVAAFTGPEQFPLDCEYADGTPRIYSVNAPLNNEGGGPYLPTFNLGAVEITFPQLLVINSMGVRSVQNPEYCNPAAGPCPVGADLANKFVVRDYGFGDATGTVTLGDLGPIDCDDAGLASEWTDETLLCAIPFMIVPDNGDLGGGRQLTITRANGTSTVVGATIQVGLRDGADVVAVSPSADPMATPITDAILAGTTGPNDLILVRPGQYNEMVIMSKPVQLQGWGEGSTTINALKAPADKLDVWRTRVDGLLGAGAFDLLPGQEVGVGIPEPTTLQTEEGAGVLALAAAGGPNSYADAANHGARIDGFTIKSADTGGGIVANGYTDYLQISNNRLSNNSGFFGGGVRVGHPLLIDPATLDYTDGDNDGVAIHHNQVVFNGGLGGWGGGISMCTGSDSYAITENWVCGNFQQGEGAGIGHIGLSEVAPGGEIPLIADNTVIFNESFFQGSTVSGGGIFIGGAAPATVEPTTGLLLSHGSGDVQVIGNLIHGNSAGAGDGGGIRVSRANGRDIAANLGDASQWYKVDLYNNMITNNVAGLAGGGISLFESVEVDVQNNTIAHNDSLATAGEAFTPGSSNQSEAQAGVGIRGRDHGGDFAFLVANYVPPGTLVFDYSNPVVFDNNILWENRSFFFWVDTTSGCIPGDPGCLSTFGLCPAVGGGLNCPDGVPGVEPPVFDDVFPALVGTTNLLTPDVTPPLVESEYFNGARSAILQPEFTSGIQVPAAFDEGGNFIKPQFGPLSLRTDDMVPDGIPGVLIGDYHILAGSDAHDAAAYGLADDFDGDLRPQGAGPDIGADEFCAAGYGECAPTDAPGGGAPGE